ncbi:MAG: hypothetical protein CL666_06145 [Balneola sp.]|nr:hypothetical protein [Balneola sp.]|tara:strand:- start:75103 stop:78735 length:3633 start_codon:yes stop_codon:yes gene_type:complete
MKKFIPKIISVFVLLFLAQSYAEAQQVPQFLQDPQYRSSREYRKSAEADGNRVWITFENTGYLAGVGEIRGQWPRGSEVNYIGDVSPVVSLEIPVDTNNDGVADTLVQHAVTTPGDRQGQGARPGQTEVWAFEPIPGFANMDGENDRPAISIDENTWPDRWPDQPTWVAPDGTVEWNGFFGRGIQNADFETYFWADDHNDKFMQENYGFRPDSTDLSRGGQGLAMSVRGLQWSQFLAQDAMFYIYEITNTSTTTYPRVSVGLVVGTAAGEPASTGSGDTQDDLAFFDQGNRIVYSWDANDQVDATGQDVGYVGYAFMESPGDPNDGIDNDGDGDPNELNADGFPYTDPALVGSQQNSQFNASDFQARTINPGDPIILIDEETYERSVVYMENGPMTVTSQGIQYDLTPGMTLQEAKKTIQGQIDAITVTEKNLIDDDLDGIIDEDASLHNDRRYQELDGNVAYYPSLYFKNYVGLAEAVGENGTATLQDSIEYGLLNPMVDESPYDGIDNDGDWNALTDDVGADGVSGTGDAGEGDGVPTVGEPNFELLDVDETDQVGLSSFYYFTPPGAVRLNEDQQVWNAMSPGFFTTNNELSAQQPDGVDGDFIFSSGYFRLEPGQTLRFSLALVYGEDLANITNNVQTIQEIYDRNYNFARPPEKPTLNAAVGDEKVTLYWNSIAEESEDPILGKDFEGYKLFKSTDPNFLDPDRITDAFGNDALLEPLAQFDLDNGINGLWKPAEDTSNSVQDPAYVYNPDLADRVRGVPFYLGDDTGLQHSFVDTNVVNGQTYYYALVAYDRGSVEFYPAENNFSVTVRDDGSTVTDVNVVEVEPNTPVLGYQAGSVVGEVEHPSGSATGEVFVEVLDPVFLREGSNYQIRFSGDNELQASRFSVISDGDVIVSDASLSDAQSNIFDGMRLSFRNDQTRFNPDASGWADEDTNRINVEIRSGQFVNESRWKYSGTPVPFDYEIEFSDQFVATSIDTTLGTGANAIDVPETDTKFKITNVTTGQEVRFAFDESLGDDDGELGDFEYIYIYDQVSSDSLAPTFEVTLDYISTGQGRQPSGTLPVSGDIYEIKTYKAYGTSDSYSYSTESSAVDEETAQEMLDQIRVVPNPYVSAASWEGKLPPTITSGRGERKIQFQNVPDNSTIRIFTVRGELVRELNHDDSIDRGYVDWDLRTRENLDVAYGIYFYHLEAPGVGTKTGKIALIK